MRINWTSRSRVASALLLSIMLAGCASTPPPPSPDLQRRIEGASTRADHDVLARHFDGQAAGARDTAAEHRKMAKGYSAMTAIGRGGASMYNHCNSIVAKFESIAADYDGMAADHRRLAEAAKP
jgi:hypothetical protein